ncbi:MAG TPA: AAA family ATPase [Acidimicrobiales bacterium]|nr:AAA family ATPase [Acidimicrobiales bacterium]
MKIAVTGKGGAGKSTISGALIRTLAAAGHRVVAVDADPNPNLGISLGLPHDTVETMQPILNALLASGHTHNDPTPEPDELLARFGVPAGDGVVLIATGKIERPSNACLCCGSHNTTRQFFGQLPDADRVVVADLEAGLNDLMWAKPGPGDTVLVVAETSAKSVEVARRGCRLAESMGVQQILGIANRAAGDDDVARLAEILGVEVVAVPDDPVVLHADHLGVSPYDTDPDSPAMRAVAAIAERVTAGLAVTPGGARP